MYQWQDRKASNTMLMKHEPLSVTTVSGSVNCANVDHNCWLVPTEVAPAMEKPSTLLVRASIRTRKFDETMGDSANPYPQAAGLMTAQEPFLSIPKYGLELLGFETNCLLSRQFLLKMGCSWANLAMVTCWWHHIAVNCGIECLYLYFAKANAHLWILPGTWGDTDLYSWNSDRCEFLVVRW